MLRSSFIAVMQQALNPRLSAMDLVYVGFALLKQLLIPVGFMGGLLILVAIAIQLVVTGFGISLKKLTPDIQRLNPLASCASCPARICRLSCRRLSCFPSSGWLFITWLRTTWKVTSHFRCKTSQAGTTQVFRSIESLLWKASFLFVIFGIVDLLRQKSRYQRELR